MKAVLEHNAICFLRSLFVLVCFFFFQSSNVTVLANTLDSGFDPHSPISEIYTYDEIESSTRVKDVLSDRLNWVVSKSEIGQERESVLSAESNAAKGASKVKYIGRLEDLKDIPRSQTLLDDLPNLGSPKANYYQNMSVLRKAIRDGYTIKDASFFRPNSQLAPTLLNPNRTVGQTFLGAERLLLKNRGLWP